jgi:tetratricopeptide (TPR) repeat protein
MNDLNGLALTTRSSAAGAAFDRTLRSYVGNRVDMSDHLAATLEADPEFSLAHSTKGYLMMLMYKSAVIPRVKESAASARKLARDSREKQHVEALDAWSAGDLERALRVWEEILAAHPTDVLAMRLAHFNYFWLGRRNEMRASMERVAPRCTDAMGTYAIVLSCLAFGLEETGDYAAAERAGRRAVEIDPTDGWGAHAVAHVLEMQGREKEGIDWLDGLARHWDGINNFVHHLWWHKAMFHYARREFDAVLELYDQRFRNLSSPLVVKMPDLYIDIQNAASMLFRLERQGVDVGERWNEIADRAEARIGDCLSAFTLPHWMMALSAAARDAAAEKLLNGLKEYAACGATTSVAVRDVALPVCKAVLAHRKGRYEEAVKLLTPLLKEQFSPLGASHAQRDVLMLLYRDAATKVGKADAAATKKYSWMTPQ